MYSDGMRLLPDQLLSAGDTETYRIRIKYKEDLSEDFVRGVVTGIIKPDFIERDEDLNNWEFKKYTDICKRIYNIAQEEQNDF